MGVGLSDAGPRAGEVGEPLGGDDVCDSKDPDGVKLLFAAAGWQTSTQRVQGGRYDLA